MKKTRMRQWNEADDKFLEYNYANNTNVNIGKAIGRTAGAVFTRAQKLGLKKSREFQLAKIRQAQKKSVENNRKWHTPEEIRAKKREQKRNRRAWLKENDKEGYEKLLEVGRRAHLKNKLKQEGGAA